ncbi:hypothetical protein EKG40_19060 [Pseudomonas moorei]|nr:hypothetical protein EKG40_19060 [Pseudomonas moorei]
MLENVDQRSLSIEDVLSSLGLPAHILPTVVEQLLRDFRATGPNKPKSSPGTNAWARGIEVLREETILLGWTPDEPNNQPRTLSPDKKVAITVSSGDANTGNPHKEPQTRNDKGSQTSKCAKYNSQQGELFPSQSNIVSLPTKADETLSEDLWILLFYIDVDKSEVRYELSRPTSMSENSKVNGWSHRLIMPALSFDQAIARQAPDSPAEVDVPVTPKL